MEFNKIRFRKYSKRSRNQKLTGSTSPLVKNGDLKYNIFMQFDTENDFVRIVLLFRQDSIEASFRYDAFFKF